jgi:type II secretory pathway pseudopilin PulG
MKNKNLGFTLLEIAFALILLSGSLVVVIGLQSSNIKRAVSDRNQQKAALLARSILSAIETDPEAVQEQNTEENVDKLLQKLIPTEETQEERLEQSEYLANLIVQIVEMPIPPDTIIRLKKIDLTITHKSIDSEPFKTVYFLPAPAEPE